MSAAFQIILHHLHIILFKAESTIVLWVFTTGVSLFIFRVSLQIFLAIKYRTSACCVSINVSFDDISHLCILSEHFLLRSSPIIRFKLIPSAYSDNYCYSSNHFCCTYVLHFPTHNYNPTSRCAHASIAHQVCQTDCASLAAN